MLDRMCVLGSERDWGGKSMVLFVDAGVELRGVEQSVAVVEEDLTQDDGKSNVA